MRVWRVGEAKRSRRLDWPKGGGVPLAERALKIEYSSSNSNAYSVTDRSMLHKVKRKRDQNTRVTEGKTRSCQKRRLET